MINFFRNRARWLLPVASGILGALALDVPYLWPLAFAFLLPFFYFLRTARSYAEAFFGGWFGGFILIGGALVWFWETLPLDWLGVEGPITGIVYIAISWGVLSAVLSSTVALWALGSRSLLQRGSAFLILIPVLWMICEYARAWLFAVLTYGEGSVFGAHFTAGFIGYALANHPLILQLASTGGIYALSFTVVLFNILAWFVLQRRWEARSFLAVGLLIAMGGFSSAVPAPASYEGHGLSVALLSTSFPATFITTAAEEKDKERELRELIRKASSLRPRPDVIVLPEDSRFIARLIARSELASFIGFLGLEKPVLLVDSSRVTDHNGDIKQSLFFYNSESGSLIEREKGFLVPQGEYVPKLFTLIVGLFGHSTERIEARRTYHPGKGTSLAHVRGVPVGGSFCAELLSPSIHREVTAKGARLIVNVSSQSWFHGSNMVYYQMQLAAKVRAVETGLPIYVAMNGAPAFAVDGRGDLVGQSSPGNKEILLIHGKEE